MKHLRYGLLAVIATMGAWTVGCGSNNTQNPIGFFPTPTPFPTATPTPNPNSRLFGTLGFFQQQPATQTTTFGTLTFDGNGNILAGGNSTLTTIVANPNIAIGNHTAATQFTSTVNAGSFTVNGDNKTFTAHINTTGPLGTNDGTVSGTIASDGAFAAGESRDAGNHTGLGVLVNPLQNATVASVHGTYNVYLADVSGLHNTAVGTVTFDGLGGITAANFTFTNPNTPPTQLQTAIDTGSTFGANGYTVASNGFTTAVINFNNGDAVQTHGFIGTDGTLSFALNDQAGVSQLGFGFLPVAASTADLNGTVSFFEELLQSNGFLAGTLNFNGVGGITGGSLSNNFGTPGTVTNNGTYSINGNGTFGPTSFTVNSVTTTIANGGASLNADKSYAVGVSVDNTVAGSGGPNNGLFTLIK